MNRRRQVGTTTVEFAVVGAVFFVLLFGMIEFSRAFFVWNTLNEATRRGARVAVVLPPQHDSIGEVAVFSGPGGGTDSPIVAGLTVANVELSYLRTDGSVIAISAPDPSCAELQAVVPEIALVRVAIVDYQHQLLIPFFMQTITAPRFEAVLPRESLGYMHPDNPCI